MHLYFFFPATPLIVLIVNTLVIVPLMNVIEFMIVPDPDNDLYIFD